MKGGGYRIFVGTVPSDFRNGYKSHEGSESGQQALMVPTLNNNMDDAQILHSEAKLVRNTLGYLNHMWLQILKIRQLH